MTNEEAKKMLKAKLECLKRETSGTDFDCTRCNCDECSLNYEQGNIGEQKEALTMAIKALEQTIWIPVSERPQEGRYLCTYEHCDGKCIDFGSFDGKVWYIKPIAYMPLPQPYKAESKKDVCNDCYYNDGDVHAECVICDKAESEDEE